MGLGQEAPGCNANPLSYLSTRIRFSPDVRSVDLVLATRAGVKGGRAVCRSLGVDVGQRVRSAPLVQLSSTLGIEGTRLPDRGLGDLVLSQLRGFPRESGRSTDEANKMMSTVKSRRNQVLDRFRKRGCIDGTLTSTAGIDPQVTMVNSDVCREGVCPSSVGSYKP